jgi:hypothetical protein
MARHMKIILLLATLATPCLILFQNCTADYKITTTPASGTAASQLTAPTPPPICLFNGESLADGAQVTAYQNSTVPYGQTCVSEPRLCTDGQLSGNYSYLNCSVGAPVACLFNGQTIASGATVTAYQNSTVPYGSTCTSETQTCTNGALSGSYSYAACDVGAPVSCLFNGQTIASGTSISTYSTSTVPYGQTCVSQTRTCTNGQLSGSATFASCKVDAPASCLFNGQTVVSGSSVVGYTSSSVPYGQTCTSQSMTCTNGTLSGNATYGSCVVNGPASCLFNGQTIASGSTVMAYQSATVAYGSTCASETQTCTNGTLSGTYTNASCSVDPCATTAFGSLCSGTGGTTSTTPPPPGAHAYFYQLTPIPDSSAYAANAGVYAGQHVAGSMSLLTPAAIIPNMDFYSTQINVSLQAWTAGFPGYTNLQEWFGLCYDATWTAPTSGSYTFVTAVDDAVALWIDGKLVGENDDGNIHSELQTMNPSTPYNPGPVAFKSVNLSAGAHTVEVMYYQGWPVILEVQLWAIPPGTSYSSGSTPSNSNLMQLSSPANGALNCPH